MPNNEEFIKQAFKAGLTEEQVKRAVAERNAKSGEKVNDGGLLKSIYNLAAKPVVEGAKGLGELVGSAGLTLGSMATEKIAPEASLSMAKKAKDIREKSGLSGSFDQGVTSGLGTVGTGLLKGAAGVGSIYDIATIGTAGSVKNAVKYGLEQTIKNAMFNSGMYGTGEASKSIREGGDFENVAKSFYRGATGQGTTGIFEGMTGNEDIARVADIALQVGAPILLGKQLDKVANKLVDIGENGAKTSVDMIKRGIGTNKVTENIKKFAGDQAYNTVVDDINANIKSVMSQRRLADRAGFDIGEEYLARGLSGKFDKPNIDADIKYIDSQSKLAGDELIRLSKEQISDAGFFTKNDVDSIVEMMKKGKDKRQVRELTKWAEELPDFNPNSMESILELERFAGKNAFTKSQTTKDQIRAQAYGELFHQLRTILSDRIDGADELLKFRNASTILSSALQRTKYANRSTDLETKIGMLFTPKK